MNLAITENCARRIPSPQLLKTVQQNSLEELGNFLYQFNYTVGVTSFIVVPRDELEESVAQSHAGTRVEDRAEFIVNEIRGSHFVFGVPEYALGGEPSEASFHLLADFFVGCAFLCFDRKINYRNCWCGHAEGHTSEFALYFRKNETDCFGRTGCRRNDAKRCCAATLHVLGRRTIHRLLRSGVGMNRGHEAFSDTKVFKDDLGHRSQTVCRAGSIGDHVSSAVSSPSFTPRTTVFTPSPLLGCGDDDLLGTGFNVTLGFFVLNEESCRLDYNVDAELAPRQSCRPSRKASVLIS